MARNSLNKFEKVYRAIIEETLELLPSIRVILCEPFILKGEATSGKFEQFSIIKEYAKVVKKLAKEYGLYFLSLQETFDKKEEEFPSECRLWGGVHPTRYGAKLIADEWLKLYKEKFGE